MTLSSCVETLAAFRCHWLPDGQALTEAQINTCRGHRGFVAIKKRWVGERRFAGLSFRVRLNRETESLPQATEPCIVLAFSRWRSRGRPAERGLSLTADG